MTTDARDPTVAEHKLYSEVVEAVLDLLDSYADNPLITTPAGMDPSILLDATFRALGDIIASSHLGHPTPINCTCEENAVRSLRYAIQKAHEEFNARNPSHAQH